MGDFVLRFSVRFLTGHLHVRFQSPISQQASTLLKKQLFFCEIGPTCKRTIRATVRFLQLEIAYVNEPSRKNEEMPL